MHWWWYAMTMCPGTFVPERKVSGVPSLGQCVHGTRGVPDWCVPILTTSRHLSWQHPPPFLRYGSYEDAPSKGRPVQTTPRPNDAPSNDAPSKRRPFQTTPRPKDAPSKRSPVQTAPRPNDAPSKGRLVQRTPRPSEAPSKRSLVQAMPRPSDASSKWCLVQGTHHPIRDF